MPKLLQISIEVNSGSVGRIAEQIGTVAIANGWESYITYARNHNPSRSKTIKIGSKFDVLWHGVETRILDNHCLSSRRATKKLITEIKEIAPDIIQLHHIHGYFINMRILFEYLASVDIPVVWIMHDCWAFTGHCAYFDYIGCSKWLTECNKCPLTHSYPASFCIDRSKTNYNLKRDLFTSVKNLTIVSVSQWLGRLVEQSFLSNISNTIIYNGVDVDVFSPNIIPNDNIQHLTKNRKVLLGVASTWENRKGLNDYIMLNSMLSKDYVIVLIGLSTKQIKMIPNSMIGIERTENVQELAEWYCASDILLNLSYEETFGLTTVEGMSCGTPSIVYNATASPELVTPETGLIVEKGDIKGILSAIKIIMKKGKVFYSKSCREQVLRRFDKNKRAQDYINLYTNKIDE